MGDFRRKFPLLYLFGFFFFPTNSFNQVSKICFHRRATAGSIQTGSDVYSSRSQKNVGNFPTGINLLSLLQLIITEWQKFPIIKYIYFKLLTLEKQRQLAHCKGSFLNKVISSWDFMGVPSLSRASVSASLGPS